jgi:NIMA (never in mitosis gene a)-related kinase
MTSYESLYKEIRLIGKGSYGNAFLVEDVQTKHQLIAKKILLNMLTTKEIDAAQQEAKILKNLKHPNIVSYTHSFCEKETLIIVMEFCQRGDISIYIKMCKDNNSHFKESDIMNWFAQMCLGLQYVHKQKILHRDLKSSNVFVTASNCIKIGDFGISKVLETTFDSAMTVVGTPYYMRYSNYKP